MEQTYRSEVLATEPHGIEHIKDTERHGSLMSQFNVRFASNMKATPLILGALGVTAGLGITGSIAAALLGIVLGSIGTALCVAMGPKLGLPQMVQSRASFGYRGNYIPAFLAWLSYIGWFTVDNIIGGETGEQLFHIPYTVCAIGLAVITLIVGIFGYNMVHGWERIFTWLSTIIFVILTVMAFIHGIGHLALPTLTGSAYLKGFFLEFSVMFSYTVSWATYAADTSRYMPAKTSVKSAVTYSFLGMVVSITWCSILGIVLGTLAVKGGIIPAIGFVGGPLSYLIYAVIFLGAISANVLNLYSGSLSGLTWDMPLKRIGATFVIGLIGIVLSVFFGGPKFVGFFENFLYVLVYFVTPWIAIVLIDFYMFRKSGSTYPDSRNFYLKNGGAFKPIRWSAVIALVVGVAVSIPFMAPGPFFTGPIAKAIGGADFSYFVSFIVTGAIYFLAARPKVEIARVDAAEFENA